MHFIGPQTFDRLAKAYLFVLFLTFAVFGSSLSLPKKPSSFYSLLFDATTWFADLLPQQRRNLIKQLRKPMRIVRMG